MAKKLQDFIDRSKEKVDNGPIATPQKDGEITQDNCNDISSGVNQVTNQYDPLSPAYDPFNPLPDDKGNIPDSQTPDNSNKNKVSEKASKTNTIKNAIQFEGVAEPLSPEEAALVQARLGYLEARDRIMKYLVEQRSKVIAQRSIDPHKMLWREQPKFHYVITPDRLAKLYSARKDFSVLQLSFCWWGLLQCSDDLNGYYGPVVEKGYDNSEIYDTMLLFGWFKPSNVSLLPGDLVVIANAMSGNGSDWAIIVSVDNGKVTEVLVPNGVDPTSSMAFVSRKGNIGDIVKAWAPLPQQLFDESCLVGQFWGPRMCRLKSIFSSNAVNDNLIELIFRGTAYNISDYETFCNLFGGELLRIDSTHPAWPGCIVLNNEYNQIGIVLSDNTILSKWDNNNDRYTFNQFKPGIIWYPHL